MAMIMGQEHDGPCLKQAWWRLVAIDIVDTQDVAVTTVEVSGGDGRPSHYVWINS